MSRRLLLLLCLIALLGIVGMAARKHFSRNPIASGERATGPAADALPSDSPVPAGRSVVIRKADRALGLYLEGKLAAAYPIALGRAPEGRKSCEGDGRTPEGRYYVCNRNPRSRFHLFLGLSYPNAEDAEAALREGQVSEDQCRAVRTAIAAGRQPPWDTPLGGEIGIHGGGTRSDWTLGCIAMEDEAIEELWGILEIGDPVLIEP